MKIFNKNLTAIKCSVTIGWLLLLSSCNTAPERVELSLNGTWQLAKAGLRDEVPEVFPSTVTVPGLVDMAMPALDAQDSSYTDARYFYKTNFQLNHKDYDVVQLKINKAKYHTRVYLNDTLIGEHTRSFIPTELDIKPFLLPEYEENELIISIGCRSNLPDTVINGFDVEKQRYIPGIYDDVSITMGHKPFIRDIQVAPNIDESNLRVQVAIDSEVRDTIEIGYAIKALNSQQVVVEGIHKVAGSTDLDIADFIVPFPNHSLWTPENPFLYELTLKTAADKKTTRFGMRKLKTAGRYAELNNETYFMRGTNVCVFRFFEDENRADLPWDKAWVIKLHNRFKEMNWNTIRYSLGPPPKMWYDVADSLGFLIQNEYPIWTFLGEGGFDTIQPGITSDQLASEYKIWMKDHVNHPCVVIWDAQNESVTDTTGLAIEKSRAYDLSDRPWDNGWSAPARKSDFIESHPYMFSRFTEEGRKPKEGGVRKELFKWGAIEPFTNPNNLVPAEDGSRYENANIINEYAWLWINRDGSTTTLTDTVYLNVFPEAQTGEERFEIFARYTGMLTEYWRAHRKAAGILHFSALSYSRPDAPRGQTSDNFIDLTNLEYEPHFLEYVKPAFNPVGIMIEYWAMEVKGGEEIVFPVYLTNDTNKQWSGKMRLSLKGEGQEIELLEVSAEVVALSSSIDTLSVVLPDLEGEFELVGTINYEGNEISSIREIELR